MTNEEVTAILKDCQQFWIKWRDRIAPPESEIWIKVNEEIWKIIQRYGKHWVYKEVDKKLERVEEYVAEPVALWFLNELDRRSKGK